LARVGTLEPSIKATWSSHHLLSGPSPAENHTGKWIWPEASWGSRTGSRRSPGCGGGQSLKPSTWCGPPAL